MPFIRGEHRGHSAVIRAAIIDATKYSEHNQSKHPVLRGVHPFRALIDTGASSTMISRRVVDTLALRPINTKAFSGLSGPASMRGYLFHVAFYVAPLQQRLNEDGDGSLDPEISVMQVCTKVINGAELQHETSFDVLLGMDVISTGELRISSDGTFSFRF